MPARSLPVGVSSFIATVSPLALLGRPAQARNAAASSIARDVKGFTGGSLRCLGPHPMLDRLCPQAAVRQSASPATAPQEVASLARPARADHPRQLLHESFAASASSGNAP